VVLKLQSQSRSRDEQRHKSTTVHQRCKKQPRQIQYCRYDERLLPSTRSIYAPSHFDQHQDKTSHVESKYTSNRTTPELKNPYLQSRKQDSWFSDKITEPKQSYQPSSFPRNKTKTNTQQDSERTAVAALHRRWTETHKYIFHLYVKTRDIYLPLINIKNMWHIFVIIAAKKKY
jgi:hypothetical protein